MRLLPAISFALNHFGANIVHEPRFVNILDDMGVFCKVVAYKRILQNMQREGYIPKVLAIKDDLSARRFSEQYANYEGYRQELVYDLVSSLNIAWAEYEEKTKCITFVSKDTLELKIEEEVIRFKLVATEQECQTKFGKSRGDLYLSETVITNAMWKAIMGRLPQNEDYYADEEPVTYISYEDCCDFVEEVKEYVTADIKIPTIAEREMGNMRDELRYLWDSAWYAENSGFEIHPVSQHDPNYFGLHDMYGNVFEWTEDESPSGHYAVGGSFMSTPYELESGYTRDLKDNNATEDVGLRLALYYKSTK